MKMVMPVMLMAAMHLAQEQFQDGNALVDPCQPNKHAQPHVVMATMLVQNNAMIRTMITWTGNTISF